MTREEAIALLNEQYEICNRIYDCSADQRKSYPNVPQFMEALDMALSALRPVSREQVEKVCRGEWNNINPAVLKPGVSWVCRCAKCGCPQDYKHNFCPNCGAAQTDKAVDIIMERMEALQCGN